jgi:putative peptidoglycan lipid II flippase
MNYQANTQIPPARPSQSGALAASAGLIIFLTILARPFGIFREILNATYFGTQRELDVFLLSASIPIFLCTILGGGLVQAVVPGLCEAAQSGGTRQWQILTRLARWTFVVSILIAAVNYLLAPYIVPLLFPRETHSDALRLGINTYRLLSPAIVGGMISGLFVGAANTFHLYSYTTLRSVAYNIMIMGSLILFHRRLGVYSLGVGILLAEFSQMLVVFPPIRARGFRLLSSERDAGNPFRIILTAFLPAVLLSAMGQVNYLVDQMLAMPLGEGCVSSLNYAWKLILLPATLLGVAFATPLLTFLSVHEAQKEREEVGYLFIQTVEMMLFFAVPIFFLIFTTSKEVIYLFYAWGRFGEKGIYLTSAALFSYSLGLPFQLLLPLCTAGFMAIKKPWTPVLVSLPFIPLNYILDRILMIKFSHAGIALATSLIFLINVTLLFLLLRWHMKTGKLIFALRRQTGFIISVPILFICILIIYRAGQFEIMPRTRLTILFELLSVSLLTIGGYLLLAHAFQLNVMSQLGNLKKKFTKNP